MCITAVLAATAVIAGGIGAYTSIQSANAQKSAIKYEAQVKTKQLYEQREMNRIESLERENTRSEQFLRARSSAMAAIGASGLGEHISFFQSIDPEAQKAFLKDVRSIRLNMVSRNSQIADQVQVTEFGRDIGIFNTKMTKIGAIADFIQTAASAASFYAAGATPAGAGAGGGGGGGGDIIMENGIGW